MRMKCLIVIIAQIFCLAGCYLPITGVVLDAETNSPIEGAVILVEWTKTHGIGDNSTVSYKVIEVLSDNNGKVHLEGCYSPFVNPPNVTIYKRGFVVWNNKYYFPSNLSRTDKYWTNSYSFMMSRFKKEYSYNAHYNFITDVAIHGPIDKKKLFIEAIKWEENMAFLERQERR